MPGLNVSRNKSRSVRRSSNARMLPRRVMEGWGKVLSCHSYSIDGGLVDAIRLADGSVGRVSFLVYSASNIAA